MAEPTYTIDADAKGEFLKLTLKGDWHAAITERFAQMSRSRCAVC